MGEQKQSDLVEKNAVEVSGGGPVLKAISKRLRAFNKKVKRAEEIEAIKATGKDINEQQVSTVRCTSTSTRQLCESLHAPDNPQCAPDTCTQRRPSSWPTLRLLAFSGRTAISTELTLNCTILTGRLLGS